VAAFRGRDVLEDDTARDTADLAATKMTKDKILPSDAEGGGRDKTEKKEWGGGREEEEEEEEEKKMVGVKLYTSANEVVGQGAELSPHETMLLSVMQSVSTLVRDEHRDCPPLPPSAPR